MPGTPRRRSGRRWTACVAAAAATAGALAPLAAAQAAPPAGPAPSSCRPASKHDPKRVPAIAEIAARARAGVEVGPGAIVPPALTAGRPAEVLVQLGADPLGVAALLGADPAAFWGSARASLRATAPGTVAWGGVRGDGSARLWIEPPKAGPVTMRLYLPGRAIQKALGLCPTGGWGIGSWLRRPGEPPGSAVLQVEGLPTPAPDPGPEPAPIPGPEPAP
jgi:hypothetical protein